MIGNHYSRISKSIAYYAGRPGSFVGAALLIGVWLATGPLFDYSDTWQLLLSGGTTIVTFLMLFLIQSSQNRDTAAIQVKLDELIRATQGARNSLLNVQELDEPEVEALRERFGEMARTAREDQLQGRPDTGTPEE